MKSRFFVAAVLALLGAVTLGAGQQPAPAPPPGAQAPPEPSPQPPPEQPPLTFRVEVNYVEVDAVVTDAQGNTVTNLTQDDFEVLEDGRPQKVTAFSLVDIPIERAERPLFAAGPIEPDVQTNSTPDGRLYLIVLDDLHTSFTNTPRVKAALRQFLQQNFGTNDRAAVVYTSGRGQDGQDFTNNPRLLMAAVDRFTGRNLASATSERFGAGTGSCGFARTGSAGASGIAGSGMSNDPCEAERGFNARTAMTGVRRLAEFMAGVRGRRKTMLLVSEGISYDIYDIFNNRSASTIIDETRDAIAAATRSNVAVYAIDPRGLGGFEEIASIGGAPEEMRNESAVRGVLSEMQLSQNSLRTIANETGGFAAVNRNDFTDAFARIVRENSSYYLLGYYPANDRRDGRFRKIEVRVKRPGLQVRSRRGYVAPRGRAPAQARPSGSPSAAVIATREAIGSPIPVGGIPMTVFAAPFKGTAPNATVALAIELRVDQFRLTPGNGTMNGRAEVAFNAIDRAGKVSATGSHAVDITLKPETLARTQSLRVVSQMDLPPGQYQVRVAAGEEGGHNGSVLYDLDVPDFYRAPLTMSGVALTAASARMTPTVLPKNPLADFLPGPAMTTREFVREDELALFAEFYENAPGAPPHGLDITTTLRDDAGRIVSQNTDQRSSTELQGKQGGYGYTARLPLRTLEPGLYVIRVEGKSRIGDRENAIGRDVQIRVK